MPGGRIVTAEPIEGAAPMRDVHRAAEAGSVLRPRD